MRAQLPLASKTAAKASRAVACRAAGQKVFITGGNTGIGYETALALAKKGSEVTMACRDVAKAEAALSKLR
jgi:retinol dehydrogenase-12